MRPSLGRALYPIKRFEWNDTHWKPRRNFTNWISSIEIRNLETEHGRDRLVIDFVFVFEVRELLLHPVDLPAPITDRLDRDTDGADRKIERYFVRIRFQKTRPNHKRRPERRMSRKREFRLRREDPHRKPTITRFPRSDERRLGIVHLPRNATHLFSAQTRTISENGELIPCVLRRAEHVHNIQRTIHEYE